ncbi:MAG: hypothetical protein KKB31_06250 [Nanoarchaeota archaeon]|nr:hypothetical protein [Nanoarchaeota archaeon]
MDIIEKINILIRDSETQTEKAERRYKEFTSKTGGDPEKLDRMLALRTKRIKPGSEKMDVWRKFLKSKGKEHLAKQWAHTSMMKDSEEEK